MICCSFLDARIIQRLLDKSQHELLLTDLVAGALGFAVEVTLQPLEEFLGDLECHCPVSIHFLSFFLIIIVFCDKFCNVLAQRFA